MTPSLRPRALLVVLAIALSAVAACGDGTQPERTTPATSSPLPTASPATTVPAANGPTTTGGPNAIGDAEVVLVAELTGGCMMMGPNCPTYVLWDDGRAIVARSTPIDPFEEPIDDTSVESVGFIDPALAAAVDRLVAGTDFDVLRDRLEPGSCNGCVDGIDTVITVGPPSGLVRLSSIDVEFDVNEPFFAAVGAALEALQRELPLGVQSR